jgi:hypothetical protein
VEVLNLGATAVASYPIACILSETLQHEPDLVVIMVGNNEFYGAYGVASLPEIGQSPLGMRAVRWIRKLGLSQWLDTLFAPPRPKSGALMGQLALDQQVRRDSPLRLAAAKSLRQSGGHGPPV